MSTAVIGVLLLAYSAVWVRRGLLTTTTIRGVALVYAAVLGLVAAGLVAGQWSTTVGGFLAVSGGALALPALIAATTALVRMVGRATSGDEFESGHSDS